MGDALNANPTLKDKLAASLCTVFASTTGTSVDSCTVTFTKGSVNANIKIEAAAGEELPEPSALQIPDEKTILAAVVKTEGVDAIKKAGKDFTLSGVQANFFK